MSGFVDLSEDFDLLDNMDASVTLTSVRNSGNVPFTISNIQRCPLTSRELSASAGVYTGNDIVFEMSGLSLADMFKVGLKPKPADVVTDATGIEYTTLNVDFRCRDANGYQLYVLTTRDLVLANDLQDQITIQLPTITLDTSGVKVKAWPPVGGSALYDNLPARVQLMTQEVAEERGILAWEGLYDITVGSQLVNVTYECRAIWPNGVTGAAVILDLVDIHNPTRIDELPKLAARLKP